MTLRNANSASSPQVSIPYYSYTDASGSAVSVVRNGSTITITGPGSPNPDTTVTLDGAGRVASVIDRVGTTTYSFSDSGSTRTTVVTDPLGHAATYTFDINLRRMLTATDATNRKTMWDYDNFGRVWRITRPGGGKTQFTYDTRGNVTETRQVSRTPGTPPDLVSQAWFYCLSAATCNKPGLVQDARGNRTNYEYDSSTGNVTSITAPADQAGIRATTTFSYVNVNGVAKLEKAVTCTIAASCAGSSGERVTRTSYNANGLPVTTSIASGDNAISLITTSAYDDVGNLISVDGPLPGGDDTIRYRYNVNRQIVGVISPDPDGSGPRARAATRLTYDAKGRQTKAEAGVVTGVDDAAWSAFSSRQQSETTYDAASRPETVRLISGGTLYASTSYSYNRHRLDRVTQAMNGAGPDRITAYGYDDADRQTLVTSAVGTADQSDDVATVYNTEGLQATVRDANGNATNYEYDGFYRLVKTIYADGSYEQLTPDENGNVKTRRLRDNQSIGFEYDALNRLVKVDRPNSVYWETDRTYGYNQAGDLTQASDSNGRALGFTYDALGRKTAQSDNWYGMGNASFAYDSAGRRSRLTWGDGQWIGYDYLTNGAMNTIRDASGNPLVSFGYDDLGQRTSLTRSNGTVTTYGFDPVARLNSLALVGGNQPTAITMQHNFAGQIASRTMSNDAYAWSGHYNVDRSYGVNGLNQLTNAGATALSYDGRGNLTASGSDSFVYTADNQLAVGPGNTGLAHDPLGRLFNGVIDPGVNTTLLYDGADVIAEINQNGGALLRRYVHGPAIDEPLIWYEGAGFGDRRFLHADERGSIVEVTNDAGNAIAINRYDDFGIPQAGNIGRFQYTGQKWLPTIGLYDYKARMYSPTLGRFLQTDPIGYGDGMNWYNYAGSDPVNRTDPTGTTSATYCAQFIRRPAEGNENSNPYYGQPIPQECYELWNQTGYEITVNGSRAPKLISFTVDLSAIYSPLPNVAGVAAAAASALGGLRVGRGNPNGCNGVPGFAAYDAMARSAIIKYPQQEWPVSLYWLRGIYIHNEFTRSIVGSSGFKLTSHVGVAYKDNDVTGWLTSGSVRPDAIHGNIASPDFIVELKTGGARLGNVQLNNYKANLPKGTTICEIYEGAF